MSTTAQAAHLFQLQQVDLELDQVSAELQAITHKLKGDAELGKLRSETKIAQQQLQSGEQTQKEVEWSLEEIGQQLTTQETRLSNGARNDPAVLQQVQQEVQNLRAHHNRQQEKLVQVTDAAEALREMAQRKLTTLQKAESLWQHECSALLLQRTSLEERQETLQKNREELVSTLPADLLDRYTTMRRTKQGRAISKVENNACQWCLALLTPSELKRIQTGSELQTCTNCGRILYDDDV